MNKLLTTWWQFGKFLSVIIAVFYLPYILVLQLCVLRNNFIYIIMFYSSSYFKQEQNISYTVKLIKSTPRVKSIFSVANF